MIYFEQVISVLLNDFLSLNLTKEQLEIQFKVLKFIITYTHKLDMCLPDRHKKRRPTDMGFLGPMLIPIRDQENCNN